MGGAALRRRLGPMCCRTGRCWRMARPRAHTQPARWLRVREAERARDVCSVPAATAARAAAAERAALGACAERSAGSEAGCEARARHDHRDGDPGAQRLLTSAAQHSCSPALLGNSTFRETTLSLAPFSVAALPLPRPSFLASSFPLPSLSLALSLFSPVPFPCDSQRLSVNVSRSAQDLQRGTRNARYLNQTSRRRFPRLALWTRLRSCGFWAEYMVSSL